MTSQLDVEDVEYVRHGNTAKQAIEKIVEFVHKQLG
jgi:hypothetical protein